MGLNWRVVLAAAVLLHLTPPRGPRLFAQKPASDSAKVKPDTTRPNPDSLQTWGSISPGKGFTVASTDRGTIAISAYVLWRYLNQLPVHETYLDHLGVSHLIDTRNDFQWHRVLLSFLGWVYIPKLSYVVTCWTVNSTTQVAIVGALEYEVAKQLTIGGGINGLPGTRSLLGSHPYWLATDRFMADEFFRPGFTSGIWATGELLPRFYYRAMLGNSITQLGITAGQLTRNLATSANVWWLPTTGEFGPRGGFGDYEDHKHLALRLGTSYTHSHENRFAQITSASPDNAQIRLSDGVLLFQTGALAEGVTINDATYQLNAFDAGAKYRGAFLQTEIYLRRLNRFAADGPLPNADIYDSGWYLTGSYMVVKKKLELYGVTSQVYGQFNRSTEGGGGLNWYPDDTRNMRVNLFVTGVNRSPTSSLFGYYVSGLRGEIISVSTSLFF
jgi:hypothetical protein